MSLQIRYVYSQGGQRVLGEWYWVTDGEYYYTSPGDERLGGHRAGPRD